MQLTGVNFVAWPESVMFILRPTDPHAPTAAAIACDADAQVDLSNEDDAEQIRVTLEPVEMSLHNPDILHGSAPNLSAKKRVGFVIRYANPEARPLNGRPRVVPVRGQVGHARFQLAEPPSASDAELALRALRDSAAQHFDVVLQNLRLAKR